MKIKYFRKTVVFKIHFVNREIFQNDAHDAI